MMVRLFRYLIGLVIALVLLYLVLPRVGYPETRFLPPSMVYAKADGTTPTGLVIGKRSEQTNDPFAIGNRLYFIGYKFFAPPIDQPDSKKTVEYQGEVRVDRDMYQHTDVNNYLNIRYVKSYPWVNGVDGPGRGCGVGSNILSGWLIWVGVALGLAYLIMVIIDQFASKQDF